MQESRFMGGQDYFECCSGIPCSLSRSLTES
jgi:hypothetical protein